MNVIDALEGYESEDVENLRQSIFGYIKPECLNWCQANQLIRDNPVQL
ncbi:hypothetical protein [Rufibacter sp. XAAS-G3-1]|nr:hypothetical protein [Rufibacter sp. XAAS-G3-1]